MDQFLRRHKPSKLPEGKFPPPPFRPPGKLCGAEGRNNDTHSKSWALSGWGQQPEDLPVSLFWCRTSASQGRKGQLLLQFSQHSQHYKHATFKTKSLFHWCGLGVSSELHLSTILNRDLASASLSLPWGVCVYTLHRNSFLDPLLVSLTSLKMNGNQNFDYMRAEYTYTQIILSLLLSNLLFYCMYF